MRMLSTLVVIVLMVCLGFMSLLFFHGNAGNVSHRLDSSSIFHEIGLSVFIIDYRGYGKSGGRPS